MRCLTLARVLREKGAEVFFICREHPNNLADFIEAQGFPTMRLPVLEKLDEPAAMHRHWLGAEPAADATATLQAIDKAGLVQLDWVIVDHYALDHEWQSIVRSAAQHIMVIDDLADRRHDCDLLLDQNLVANLATRYDGLVAPGTVKLLGPRYALLQPEYAALRASMSPRRSPPQRILVYFGASDPAALSHQTLRAFLDLHRGDIRLDLVIGPMNSNTSALRETARGHSNVTLYEQVPSLAELMLKADFAVGASGATSWERICLRLPAIVITIADNQRPIAEELQRRNLVVWLGDAGAVGTRDIEGALRDMIERTGNAADLNGDTAQVDGLGARRVVETLMAKRQLRIVIVSDAESWIRPYVNELVSLWTEVGHSVAATSFLDYDSADIVFFLSYGRIAPPEVLARAQSNIVVHGSALPEGRGWSPWTWQILEGRTRLPVTLFEAAPAMDSGRIYDQRWAELEGHELIEEWQAKHGALAVAMCIDFAAKFPDVLADGKQQEGTPTHYRRRRPADSRLDPHGSLADQFNLLRVVDNRRYPAFFELAGETYVLTIRKREDSQEPSNVN